MTVEELEQIAESVRATNSKHDNEINVCMGTGCLSQHSDKLRDALTAAVGAQGKKTLVRRTGCMGLCAAGPLVLVDPDEILYQHVKAEDAGKIAASLGGDPVAELQCNLRQHFDEGEIIELAAVIGVFNYFNRFNNALKMEPTK